MGTVGNILIKRGQGRMRGKGEATGGVAGHVVQRPGVIEHRQGELVEFVVVGVGAEEVSHNRIDVRSMQL